MLLFFCFSRGEKSEAVENAVMWAGGRICDGAGLCIYRDSPACRTVLTEKGDRPGIYGIYVSA